MQATTLDYETHLIVPAKHVPKPVCLAIDAGVVVTHESYQGGQRDQLFHCRFDAPAIIHTLRTVLARGDMLVGANIAFDLAVTCAEYPELVELVWEAFDAFRVWDVQHAEKLINLAQGKLSFEYNEDGAASKVDYSLAGIVQRRFGHVMDKATWRLVYGTLYGKPLREWPADAVTYPIGDLSWTRRVLEEQLKSPAEWLVDVTRQTRAAWWIYLMSARGFKPNRERTLKLEHDLLEEMQKLLAGDPDAFDMTGKQPDIRMGLVQAGLVDRNGKRETKAAGARLSAVLTAAGKEVPHTVEGQVQLTKEACKDSGDLMLSRYSRYTELIVTLGKARALKDAVLADAPIQSKFEVVLESGRTSCSGGKAKKALAGANRMAFGFQIQNVKKEPGLRECFGPRPGYLLGSLDYGQLESCTWAQVCLDLFGFSKMAEMLNAGIDVHSKLGAMIFGHTYEWVMENRKKKGTPEGKIAGDARQGAKPFVFGKPGGMGARGIQAYAKAPPYNVILTLEEATHYGNTWAKLFIESKEFFAYVKRCVNYDGVIRQVRSNRIRGGCGFTDGCNTLFQGLAADVAKAALYECSRACYTGRDSRGNRYPALHGSYIVNFVHDEGLFEFPADRAHEAAFEAASIMNRTSEEWMPGCPSKVEPCLMLEWAKDAATVYDENKRLIPWTKAA